MVVYGQKAETAAQIARDALRRVSATLPVCIHRERSGQATDTAESRYAKVTLLDWTPFDQTAYFDADTMAYSSDCMIGFEMLADGFDLVIVPSNSQGDDNCLWHVGKPDRAYTLDMLRYTPLQLQAGVFYVAKNARTHALFAAWAREWSRFGNQDQGALLRALAQVPVKIWLLGRPFNGGAVIGHRFGAVRA